MKKWNWPHENGSQAVGRTFQVYSAWGYFDFSFELDNTTEDNSGGKKDIHFIKKKCLIRKRRRKDIIDHEQMHTLWTSFFKFQTHFERDYD